MKVWKIDVEAKQFVGDINRQTWHVLGVASTTEIASRKALQVVKRMGLNCRVVIAVECLGDLDFCTKR
ncbi:MAG: hypothetical protein MUP81_03330 [Dehalococcoidia bacterium]|nr:hypothetical protein [Dehalococcoidia bacterium]